MANINPNAKVIDAMTQLTEQLRRDLEYRQDQDQKVEKASRVLRVDQDDRMRAAGQEIPQPKPRIRPKVQTRVVGDSGPDHRLPPDSDERSFAEDQRDLQADAQQRTRGLKARLGRVFQHPVLREPLGPKQKKNLPPNAAGQDGQEDMTEAYRSGMSNPASQGSARPGQDPFEHDALTLAILGEHGMPAPLRNTALDYFGFKKTIDWASQAANGLSDRYDTAPLLKALPGVNPNSLGTLTNTLGWAQNNAGMLFAGKQLAGGLSKGFSHVGQNLQGYQAAGQQIGYGPSAALGQSIFGHHNPLGDFSTAARVGGAYSLEAQALQGRMPGGGFGNGLSGAQAHDVMETLAGQGFGMQPLSSVGGGALNLISSIPGVGGPLASLLGGLTSGQPQGDAANIAQNFMRPLMERFPGIKAQDLGQFTGSLRYGGTSIQQLTDQLNSMGVEARAAKETVGQFASSVASTAQTFEGMGSSPQGGYAIGTGFTNVTGKDPQFAGMFGKSPLVQGLGMTQYGILPSGLGDMNSGAFSNLSLASLQMLQRATAGLAVNKYQTVNGHRVLVESGKQAQYDQIAQMSGLPSNVVKSMLEDQSGITARAHAQTMLGDPTTGTGFYQYLSQHKGKLTDAQYKQASQVWHATVDNTWRGTGISKQEMARIDKIPGLRDRAKAYSGALANAAKNDRTNQIQNTPNPQTVQVQFTGAAAKFFQQVGNGPSPNKKLANSGMFQYAGVTNSIPGDTSVLTSTHTASML